MAEQKPLSLLPIFLTVFLDLVGIGIIIPIFALLFFRPEAGIVPEHYSASLRALLLGFFIASYPLAQFIGAPILGALSDRHGRKPILLVSLCGTLLGYLIFGFGIVTHSLPLLLASRILAGFTGGNIATAFSVIADLSDQKSKARNFGLIGMAFGFGFIIGPFIGGKLSDPSLVSWFDFATPFWFAAILCFINILLVLWRFRETLTTRLRTPLSVWTGIRNIQRAFHLPNLRTIFIVIFLLTFGFNFFTQFFQVYLIQKFQITQSQIGDMFAFMGIWIAFSQGVINRFVSRKFMPRQVLPVSMLLLGILLPLLLFPKSMHSLYFLLPFIAISNGLTYPNVLAIVSGLGTRESQGEILGIQQSIQALAMGIPPIISGFIISMHRSLPIIVGSLLIFLAWTVFVFKFRPQNKEVFREI